MNNIEDDPILGRFFDTPEKKARWMVRIKFALLIWLIFVIIGIAFWIWTLIS